MKTRKSIINSEMFYVFIPGARFARLPRRRRARAGGRGFPAALLPAALPRPTPDGAGGLCRRTGIALGRSGRSGPVQRYQPASQLPVLASKMEKQILSFFSSSFFFLSWPHSSLSSDCFHDFLALRFSESRLAVPILLWRSFFLFLLSLFLLIFRQKFLGSINLGLQIKGSTLGNIIGLHEFFKLLSSR